MSDLRVLILAPGCHRCDEMEANVQAALAELGYIAHIERVEDIHRISELGVVQTPAVLINGDVLVQGAVPTVADILERMRQVTRR